jgi:hypothetical protein
MSTPQSTSFITDHKPGVAVSVKAVDADEVEDEYEGLGDVISIHPLSGGLSNSNYRVVTTAPCDSTRSVVLLKVCDEKTVPELEVFGPLRH